MQPCAPEPSLPLHMPASIIHVTAPFLCALLQPVRACGLRSTAVAAACFLSAFHGGREPPHLVEGWLG
jgi:hypothetical protein